MYIEPWVCHFQHKVWVHAHVLGTGKSACHSMLFVTPLFPPLFGEVPIALNAEEFFNMISETEQIKFH